MNLSGKAIVFALGLAGLYALWRQTPAPRPAPPVGPPVVERGATESLRIGYIGSPPPAALALAEPAYHPNAGLETETGAAVSLAESGTVADLLRDVGAGRLEAAVVDWPSVVFAARRERPAYHSVLLVSWREGADVLLTSDGAPWDPSTPVYFEPETSGEYLLRGVAASRGPGVHGRPIVGGLDARAAAGRWDRLPAAMGTWTVTASTADGALPMPDVLIVNSAWAQRNPDTVEGLLRGWLEGQSEIDEKPDRWKRFARAEAARRRLEPAFIERSLRPAPIEDQLAFVGLGDGGPTYATLVTRQMRLLERGVVPPDAAFTVPVDRVPLSNAAPLLIR